MAHLSGPFLPLRWMGSQETPDAADWWMVGLPYDGTCSFRPGTRFAPQAIRTASIGVETWSPCQQADLDDIRFYDAGDLDLPFGNRDACLAMMRRAAEETLAAGKRWMGIGGEHLVTLPVIEAYLQCYPDLGILHFDAHADLRDDYLGEKLSHATVLRRVVELTGPERLVQIGIRSGPSAEFAWMAEHGTLLSLPDEMPRALARLGNRPVFITVDLDVLDPSIMSGTGTPEPGGLTFGEWQDWLMRFKGQLNVVGADVVELSPHYDPSGVSTVTAAKVIRELLLF